MQERALKTFWRQCLDLPRQACLPLSLMEVVSIQTKSRDEPASGANLYKFGFYEEPPHGDVTLQEFEQAAYNRLTGLQKWVFKLIMIF